MGQGQEKGNGNEGLRASARRRSCHETIGGPPETLKGARDRAILGTLLDRGIRREELCLLRLRDTQSRQGRVCNASDDTHEDLVGTRLSISSSSIANGLPSPKRQRREFAWLISFSSRFGIVDVTTVFQRM
jgi:hypothetical protein